MRARTFTALFGWHNLFKIFFFFLIHFACPGFRVGSVSVVYSYCCCVQVDSSRLANIHTRTLSLSHPPPPPPPPRLERNPAFTYQDCTTVYSLVMSLLWCGGFRDYVVFLADNVYSQGLHPRRTRTFRNVQATGRTAQRSKRSLTHDQKESSVTTVYRVR